MLLVQLNTEQKMDKVMESDYLKREKLEQSAVSDSGHKAVNKTDQNHNRTAAASADFDGYGTFENEEIDEESCSIVANLLHQKLKRTSDADLNLEVFLPKDLLSRIAKDIVSMSHCEPYGLKGCVVHVNLQRNSTCHKLGQIECDPDTVATFELFLTLVEDKKCWNNLSDLMVTFLSRCLSDKVVYLSPGFRLEKRKLYRSNSVSSTSS